MVEAVREHTVEISATAQRIQDDLEAAAAATCEEPIAVSKRLGAQGHGCAAGTCEEPIVVSKRLRCTGDRMCHKTRALQGWYRETGDEVLQARAPGF